MHTQIKETSKLRVTGLCTGNSSGTGEFPAHMASNAENVSIWWRLHAKGLRVNVSSRAATDVSSCSCLRPSYWCQVLNREWRCIGAAPTGDAPTTSDWSTILLPPKVRLYKRFDSTYLVYHITTRKHPVMNLITVNKLPFSLWMSDIINEPYNTCMDPCAHDVCIHTTTHKLTNINCTI